MRKIVNIFFLLTICFCSSLNATQIVIINLDGAGEGFNDVTPASPVGGNSGTTLGEQRLKVFELAASIWETIISSNVTIQVEAKFDPLFCDSTSAVLGSAGTVTVHRDFANAPVASTWYAASLANGLSGSDLSSSADISATFNGDIDNNSNCLGSYNWYYGLDGVKPSASIELLSVVLHEIGHGLGFQTFVNASTGAKFGAPGRDDAYMLNLEDHSLAKSWPDMTNNERKASAIDTADLHWTGAAVTSKVADFSGGINQGHVRMYAPSPLEGGSSVSHFSNALSPNELMEPFDTGPKQSVGLARELFQDIGWVLVENVAPVIEIDAPVSNINLAIGSSVTLLATASDAEDGDLSSTIVWMSNIDGALGIGNVISVTLTQGTHQITANVTDSQLTSTSTSITVNILGDSDSDGMNDAWELENFGDLTRDGTGDFDGDGISDLDEYLISVTIPNGDINNDGLVNVVDALLAIRHTNNIATLTALQIARGDLYPSGAADGVFDLSDLILLQKIIHNIP